MRSIAFAPVFLAILALTCCDGGIAPPDDDDDDTASDPVVLATGFCSPGEGQEAFHTALDWEQQAEINNTSCTMHEDCPSGALCMASRFADCIGEHCWTSHGNCQLNACRPGADEDCGQGVLCYVRDFAVTAGRCAGGPNQGAACEDPGSSNSDLWFQCQDEYAGDGGNCVWEDYFEAFCPNGTCDGNPFCPNNATCDTHSHCGCQENFACVGFDDAASCAEITNPLVHIMPGMWQRDRPGWNPFRLIVDPTRPACEDRDDSTTEPEPGDACIFAWGGGYDNGFEIALILDGTVLRSGPGEPEAYGEVLNEGWRIEYDYIHGSSLAFTRVGDAAEE